MKENNVNGRKLKMVPNIPSCMYGVCIYEDTGMYSASYGTLSIQAQYTPIYGPIFRTG